MEWARIANPRYPKQELFYISERSGLGYAALPKTEYTFAKYLVQSANQALRSVNTVNSPIDPAVFGH